MSLVFFKLLSRHWSLEWVSLWESKSPRGPLKSFVSVSSRPLSFLDINLIGFHTQILWWLLFLVLWTWSWEHGVGLGPLAFFFGVGENFFSWDILPATRWDWVWLFHISGPLTNLIAILFSYYLGGSQLWLFYNLFVISVWWWEEVSTEFTCSTILTRSPPSVLECCLLYLLEPLQY